VREPADAAVTGKRARGSDRDGKPTKHEANGRVVRGGAHRFEGVGGSSAGRLRGSAE